MQGNSGHVRDDRERRVLRWAALNERLSVEGENIGVLMPNVNATVYLLLGMFAMRRTARDVELHVRVWTRCRMRAASRGSRP